MSQTLTTAQIDAIRHHASGASCMDALKTSFALAIAEAITAGNAQDAVNLWLETRNPDKSSKAGGLVSEVKRQSRKLFEANMIQAPLTVELEANKYTKRVTGKVVEFAAPERDLSRELFCAIFKVAELYFEAEAFDNAETALDNARPLAQSDEDHAKVRALSAAIDLKSKGLTNPGDEF